MKLSQAQIRAALAVASLELLMTSPACFGLTTATPLQRAIYRIADGQPLGDLADHPAVERAIGNVRDLPNVVPQELVVLGAVRSGKSLFAAGVAVRCSQRVDVSQLRPGEIPRVSIVSLDKDKAHVVLAEHLVGTIMRAPALRTLVLEEPKADSILLRHPSGRPVEVMVVAGKRAGGSLVSRWCAGAIFDEAPRMIGSDEGVVNLDDARKAVMSRMLPGALIVEPGSPWAPFGPVYELVSQHWGSPSAACVVVRGTGPDMNPTWWTPERCEELRRKDPDAHRTDVLSDFLTPEENLFASSLLEANTRDGSASLAHDPLGAYWAAMDPATRGNSWTLVIATRRGQQRIVAHAQQWTGSPSEPLSPKAVLRQIALVLRRYGLKSVETDQYYIDALVDIARDVRLDEADETSRYPVALVQSSLNETEKAQRYLAMRAKLTEGEIELAPVPEMLTDLRRVKRRATQTGISIVLPKTGDGRHCDYAPTLMLVATRNLADLRDPPRVAEDAETVATRARVFARLRERREGFET